VRWQTALEASYQLLTQVQNRADGAERYHNINWRLTAAHASARIVHEAIFQATINRQEAHVRLTHDVMKRQVQFK